MSVAAWQTCLEAQVEAFSCQLNAIDHLDHQTRVFVIKSTQSRIRELSKRINSMLQEAERPQGRSTSRATCCGQDSGQSWSMHRAIGTG